MEEMIEDRNEAFASMDKEKIIAYCKKYNIAIPEDETVFWAGVHKAICNLYVLDDTVITAEQHNKSCEWLKEYGYKLYLR